MNKPRLFFLLFYFYNFDAIVADLESLNPKSNSLKMINNTWCRAIHQTQLYFFFCKYECYPVSLNAKVFKFKHRSITNYKLTLYQFLKNKSILKEIVSSLKKKKKRKSEIVYFFMSRIGLECWLTENMISKD